MSSEAKRMIRQARQVYVEVAEVWVKVTKAEAVRVLSDPAQAYMLKLVRAGTGVVICAR